MGSSARRLLVMTDRERKRLERALHDGAQQRLVAATTTLGLALRRLDAGEDGAAELVQEASEEAKRCIEDLRDLAREIYPAVLAERGLASALNDLARRAPGPVRIDGVAEVQLAEAVELTAYFVVSHALAGLAEGEDASVEVRVEHDALVVDVRGAGVDGDRLSRLRDRVEALNGSIESGARSVVATIPLQ
ncbi:MAG TPA: histidine kinase [Thermoleophilaceae bacterium]